MLSVVDLFCGAGGFSLGAHRAGLRTRLAIDIDKNLTSSFSDNFPNTKLLLSDISRLSGQKLLTVAGLKASELDGLIGGPPCQGFSLIGKRDLADPRNSLLRHFLRLVEELRPRFFVMENVPGLLLGQSRGLLERSLSSVRGFTIIGPLLINATDFGAPTERKRVLVVGLRGSRPNTLSAKDFVPNNRPRRTVADAIQDLPNPGETDWAPYGRKTLAALSEYARQARKFPENGLGAPLYREKLSREEVSGMRATLHSRRVVSRFKAVVPGSFDAVSRCPRLDWSEASPTLRAGTGPDKGSFQSIRPIHPSSDRVITVREAARIQGFPDWFKFHKTKWHSFRMIGNSVSPYVAEHVLSCVADLLP